MLAVGRVFKEVTLSVALGMLYFGAVSLLTPSEQSSGVSTVAAFCFVFANPLAPWRKTSFDLALFAFSLLYLFVLSK